MLPEQLSLVESDPFLESDQDWDQSWDCIVIGSGAAACGAALELKADGARVVVVAERSQQERLLRLPGLALPCLGEHYWHVSEGIGREQTALWWRLATVGAGYVRAHLQAPEAPGSVGSCMLLAAHPAEAEEMMRGLRWMCEDGFEARMMSGAAASNYVPVSEAEGALLLPGAAAFDTPSYVSQRLMDLKHAGIPCLSWAGKLRLEHDPLALFLGDQAVRGESVILAQGLAVQTMLDLKKPWVFPLRGQSMVSSPIRQGLRNSVVALSAQRGHEFYRDMEDGLLVAGLNPASGPDEMTALLEIDEVFCQHLGHQAGKRLTELAHAHYARRWASVYEYTPDGLPIIGTWPGQSQLWIAAGFATSEWSLGEAAGREVARALKGENHCLRELPSASPRRLLG